MHQGHGAKLAIDQNFFGVGLAVALKSVIKRFKGDLDSRLELIRVLVLDIQWFRFCVSACI